MTELYAPAPEEMKLDEIYRVVPDREHQGAVRLEKVSNE